MSDAQPRAYGDSVPPRAQFAEPDTGSMPTLPYGEDFFATAPLPSSRPVTPPAASTDPAPATAPHEEAPRRETPRRETPFPESPTSPPADSLPLYGHSTYGDYDVRSRAASTPVAPSHGLATASLVLGITSAVLFWVPGIGLASGIIAVGTGIAALRKRQSLFRGITGLITGVMGTLGGLAVTTVTVLSVVFVTAVVESLG